MSPESQQGTLPPAGLLSCYPQFTTDGNFMSGKNNLHWQILVALALGVGAGLIWPKGSTLVGSFEPYKAFDFVGTLFLRALRMVIVPLLAGSIISGVAGVGASRGLGRLFTKTFAWYITTSLLAILIGLLLVNIIQPGVIDGQAVGERMGLQAPTEELSAKLEGRGAGDLVGIIQRMIPSNPVRAAADGQMLPLIFFCLLLGIAITSLAEKQRQAQAEAQSDIDLVRANFDELTRDGFSWVGGNPDGAITIVEFSDYFEKEMNDIDDTTLSQEIDILNTLSSYSN